MVARRRTFRSTALAALALAAAASAGCLHGPTILPAPDPMPRELSKVTQPEYVVEPPDILQIDALSLIPLPPYRIKPLDVISVRVPEAIADFPIPRVTPAGPEGGMIPEPYPVEADGTIDFRGPYGKVAVSGMTLEEAKAAIEKHLAKTIQKPTAEVALIESRGLQAIRGSHLVRPDGTIGLGQYGSVQVTGLTLAQTKAKIEAHLRQYLKDPEVTVDVLAYNSKVYYVILDGGGTGQTVTRLPVTGNETVLDAIGEVSGLGPVSDRHRIWVSRPGPDGCETVLPVDWDKVTKHGAIGTNYQLMPGDRLFVQSYPLTRLDTAMARIAAPIERAFGVALLGTTSVYTIKAGPQAFGQGFGGVR